MATVMVVGKDTFKGLVLLVVLVISLSPTLHVVVQGARSLSKDDDLELEAQLKILNKPPVKTIHTEWGDILDCINIHEQPAFDHPLLKNHKIQMKPTSIPVRVKDETSSETKYKPLSFKTPVEECPEGTVPIRRTQKEDLIRAKSLSPRNKVAGSNGPPYQFKTGLLYGNPGDTFNGATASINIYNPSVEKEQYSTAEISLEAGPNDKYNGIHFGWIVDPQLHGDHSTRSFIYWTNDGGKKPCYNTRCPGFVQVHKQVTPSSPLHVSTYGGTQYALEAMVFQDIKTKYWWLIYERNISVGYWPNSLFPLFSAGVPYIYWGGHVQTGGDESIPQMGSGYVPDANYTHACSFQNMQIVTRSNEMKDPRQDRMDGRRECPANYRVKYYGYMKDMGHTFLFGGPGASKCS